MRVTKAIRSAIKRVRDVDDQVGRHLDVAIKTGRCCSYMGQEMGILNPALGRYILHAWIWKPNPAGMFENWNPDVSCP